MSRTSARRSGAAERPCPAGPEPARNCRLCERLFLFRQENQSSFPDWFNAPVPSFGHSNDCSLLIVGLAPGLKGANRTGRPFTGDYAGDLLYATLCEFGFAIGDYGAHVEDGLVLNGCMITNAVRCAPPQNKPLPAEIRACQPFLSATIEKLGALRCILVLGRIAHDSTLGALGLKRSSYPFAHGRCHEVGDGVSMFDSFHCSRYNTNTGRLTPAMFAAVFRDIQIKLGRG